MNATATKLTFTIAGDLGIRVDRVNDTTLAFSHASSGAPLTKAQMNALSSAASNASDAVMRKLRPFRNFGQGDARNRAVVAIYAEHAKAIAAILIDVLGADVNAVHAQLDAHLSSLRTEWHQLVA